MTRLDIRATVEAWSLKVPFVISRGVKREAIVVVVTVSDGASSGRGECVPYARYGETVEGVVSDIEHVAAIATERSTLAGLLPAGAARNALDCALWDFEAKSKRTTVADLAGLTALQARETCFTLSLGWPDDMAAAAAAVPSLKLLKLKLGGAGDADRMLAVRAARPDARLVADANEAWTLDMLNPLLDAAHAANVELIEQPLPADQDELLRGANRKVAICADESAHTSSDIARLMGIYDAINIKLDKTGGLTEALVMSRAARAADLRIMTGSMIATSLAMAPAMLLAQDADWVDLDGPLLLDHDRPHGLQFNSGIIAPPRPELWG